MQALSFSAYAADPPVHILSLPGHYQAPLADFPRYYPWWQTIAPYPWSLLHFKGLLELPGRDTVPICSLFSGPDDLGFPWHSSNLDPTIPSVAR